MWLHRGIIILEMSLDPWCSGMKGQCKFEGGKGLGTWEVAIFLQYFYESIVQLFLRV